MHIECIACSERKATLVASAAPAAPHAGIKAPPRTIAIAAEIKTDCLSERSAPVMFKRYPTVPEAIFISCPAASIFVGSSAD